MAQETLGDDIVFAPTALLFTRYELDRPKKKMPIPKIILADRAERLGLQSSMKPVGRPEKNAK